VESHPSILHRKKGNQWTFYYGSTNRYRQAQLQWNMKASFSFHMCTLSFIQAQITTEKKSV
jgi:hypothetical protein